MSFELFPKESRFRDAGHSANSSVLVVEMNFPLHNIKSFPHLSTICQ